MIYCFGDISVDTLRAEICRAGEHVPLRHQSFDVLVYLLQRPGRVVTKDEILDAIWGDRVVTEGSLKHCLMEVRAAIGDHEHTLIRTIPRRGYMLDSPVTRESAATDDRTSILVTPLKDQGVDHDNAYIADGLTEEIIVELSKIPSFRVISRSSAMRLKGAGPALQDIARELGVDFILDGSIHRVGDKLRVTLQLSHVDADHARWSERYDGTLADLFDMHDEIATAVAEELAMQAPEPQPVNDEKLEDPRAIESYLRARYEVWKFSLAGLQQAERQLRNALDLVGPNTRLLATLGHAYSRYSELGIDPTGESLRKAAECIERIFELDADSSRGYMLQGTVRYCSGELRSALAPLERSLETNPTNPDALALLGYLYALSGRNQRASRIFDQVLDIDPLTPLNHCMPGFIAILEGRYADALPHYKRFLELDPQNPFALWTWNYVLLRNGKIDEASEVMRRLNTEHAGSTLAQLGTALFHGVRGEPEAARNAVTDELRAGGRNSELLSRELAHCLALAGETEEALDWLENTIRIGNINYPFWSRHDDWLASVRTEARFRSLMIEVEKEWIAGVSGGGDH